MTYEDEQEVKRLIKEAEPNSGPNSGCVGLIVLLSISFVILLTIFKINAIQDVLHLTCKGIPFVCSVAK